MELHPDCAPFAFLLGTWRGAGHGEYPTIESFAYLEEVTFAHVGKPFLSYTQKTRNAESGAPLHAEVGYLRAVGGTRCELILVQPSGIIEMHSGQVNGQTLELTLDAVHTTPTAKSVTDVKRAVTVVPASAGEPASLSYELSMAAVGLPLTHHLRAGLKQVTETGGAGEGS